MNVPLAIAALVGLVALGVVAELYERRAQRRLDERQRAHEHRRLMDEIRRHE